MRKTANAIVGILLLVQVGWAASCGSAVTTVPTAVQTATPAASPVSTEAIVPTSLPKPVLTEEPTSAPTPELVGTPTSPDQVPRITVEDLKALMDGGARVAILDNRVRESYELGHIKGAILFPWKPALTYADAELLPMGGTIVTYCECGPGEADSADVALQLIEMGVKADIKVLAHPAIEEWIELGYPIE